MSQARRTVAIVQARMSSSRLPGKVMEPVVGRPMIVVQIERLRRAKRLDALVIATSEASDDDVIAACCETNDVPCYRGSLHDVLDRYVRAARQFEAVDVVRLTADCPLADPALIDRLVGFFHDGRFDYASNCLKRTWPRGLDAEIMTMDALETAGREAREDREREHVTPFIYGHPERFALGSLVGDSDLSQRRWTVDYPEDLQFVRKVYEALHASNPKFTTADVVEFLDANPAVAALNLGLETADGMSPR